MGWVIVKRSRLYECGRSGGPQPERRVVYRSIRRARQAVKRLNRINPVGFKIERYRPCR